MKLRDLERHLKVHGCYLEREGENHTLWKNPANGHVAPVPRHREVKKERFGPFAASWTFPIPEIRAVAELARDLRITTAREGVGIQIASHYLRATAESDMEELEASLSAIAASPEPA